MNELHTRIAALRPDERKAFEEILKSQGVDVSKFSIMRRDPQVAALPLSSSQRRLWFLDQLEPNSPLYNLPWLVTLKGALDLGVLRKSFEALIERHEALRTRFVSVDGSPNQVINPPRGVPLAMIDVPTRPDEPGAAHEWRVLAEREAKRPFDLARDQLIRVTLLRLAPEHHLLVLVLHHIVADGWSLPVLFREVASFYQAFSTGQSPSLAALPIQYADFALWQRERLAGQGQAKERGFWKEALSGFPMGLALPADRPRPAVESHRGAVEYLELPTSLAEKLRELGRREGATGFMTLLAAYATLLFRYSGQEDLIIGTPVACRDREEIEGLIGFFVNTLPLRFDLSGGVTFREFLARVRRVTLDAFEHQNLPFEEIVAELNVPRDLSHSPLFQVMFVQRGSPADRAIEAAGLSVAWQEIENGTAKFDQCLNLWETGDGLMGSLEYSTDLFEAKTIQRQLGHYLRLLEAIVSNPDQQLSALPLLSDEERRQSLSAWNGTPCNYDRHVCLHELFEAQAQKTPEAVAVAFETRQLTYDELNQRANQLAHHLRSRGVRPDTLVGICLERSLEMVVGLLGILKAGGAYVPLDPEYPRERLALMLEDAKVAVLLTQASLADLLPANAAQLVRLDADWPAIASQSPANPGGGARALNLAYMIYTSGSTGQPKGAANTHGGIVNRLLWMQEAYGLSAADRVLQKTPFSFDVSVWEFFWPLITGARLVVARPGGHKDGAYLAGLIARESISTVHFVPSMLGAFLEQEGLGSSCATLKRVICSGEALSLELQERFFACLPAGLHNLYGPTEASVDATFWACKRNSRLGTVPIGRPIANTCVRILDPQLQPVPIGVPGELCLGGIGLARGYHRRPDLTAEKFIPDPFSSEPGARLYKTGDLARYLALGAIEYLGRNDYQVKIRGFRIELEEIESVLRQHPGVSQVVVVAREDVPGDRRIVAYLVVRSGTTLAVGELRVFVKQKLPDFMVPSGFVFLNSLPLTSSGKVDRKALPAPETSRPESGKTFVAPQTSNEKVLSGIWSKLLRIERVGIHDKFFELGGDSILGIQVIARANQAGLRLTPEQIFQHQTIAELALAAETITRPSLDQGVVVGPAPLTPIQQWFFEQDFSDLHHWNQARLLELRQPLDPAVIETAAQHLVAHHDALRLRFRRQDSGWAQFNAAAEPTPLVTPFDLSAVDEADQDAAMQQAAAELQARLDLARGPLLRIAWFNLGSRRPSRLLIAIHHLAVDGLSWRILLEDLDTLSQQARQGVTPRLPAKTTSFKQWAQRLAEYARCASLQPEKDHWLQAVPIEHSALPVDFPGGAGTEGSTRRVSAILEAEDTRALLQQVPHAYGTQINDVLLSALGLTLTRWMGQPIVEIHLEGHGREQLFEDVDLARTVGWFATLFPVRLDLRGSAAPGEVLKSIKEQLRRLPSRGIGYGLLRYLAGDAAVAARLRARPQPEVVFNFLGQLDQTLSKACAFALVPEPAGPVRSARARRSHVLEINGWVADRRLRVDWLYSLNEYRHATIERLAQGFLETLRSLIHHCTSPGAGGYTPSDFPEAGLNQEELDGLIAKLS